jgi:hypothetical protein
MKNQNNLEMKNKTNQLNKKRKTMNNQNNLVMNNSNIKNDNVNDFRNNLKKYFVTYGDDKLYVKPQNGMGFGVKFSELNSLSDLYDMMKGFGTPTIIPKVILLKDINEFMIETNQIFSLNGYFDNENNFKIIENKDVFLKKYNPQWVKIDNQIYRDFFYLTLGQYSGYQTV